MPFLPRNVLATIIAAMILGMLFIGLYPFNYFPANRVASIDNGLSFTRGIALIKGNLTQPLTYPLTLEIALTPSRTYNHWIPNILSLCDRSGREVIYLGQWKNSLIARFVKEKRGIEKVRKELGVKDVLEQGQPVLITLVFKKGKALIYANGQLKQNSAGFNLAGEMSKHPISSLVLGNSSTGDSPWSGRMNSFSVWSIPLKAVDIEHRYEAWRSGKTSTTGEELIRYNLKKTARGIINKEVGSGWNLSIPKTLTPLRTDFLGMPSIRFLHERSFYKDAVINLIGFVPLGMALAIFFTQNNGEKYRWKKVLLPILFGGLLSLFIEANQVFLITRDSSLTDLVLNILGTGLGVGIAMMVQRSTFKVQR